MSFINNIRLSLLIVLNAMVSAQAVASANDEKILNPYKAYDNKYEQFGLIVIKDEKDNVLASVHRLSYQELTKRRTTVIFREALNSKYNLASKLAGKMFYFLSNGYMPQKRPSLNIQQPFIIFPQKIDVINLALYSSESLSVTLKLKEGIFKAEVLDIVPSSDQILTLFCSKNSLIKKPSCSQTIYDTDDKNISIIINYKIIPKKLGLSHFKLYLLCKINDSYLTVVTIVGQYLVNRTLPFTLHFYNPHFLIRYGKSYYNYLWLKNHGSTNVLVTDIIGFGNQLGLNYPPNFKKKYFSQQPIPAELRKKIEESDPSYWSIPAKDERPIIEMFFMAIPKSDTLSEKTITNNRTKTTHTAENGINKNQPLLDCETSGNDQCGASIHHSEAHNVNIYNEVSEPQWPNLEFNIFKLVIDGKMYYLNLLTYFNDDMRFWEHEFINLGVFCSRYVRHEASIFASNRLEKAAVLTDVFVEQSDPDFKFEIATFYKHNIILPFVNEKFLLLKLIVRYTGKNSFAVFKGNLVAKLDLGTEKYVERLPIQCSYASDIFEVNNKGLFVVDHESKSFAVWIRQKVVAELIINKIEIIDNADNDKLYTYDNLWERNNTLSKHAFPFNEFVNIFIFKFNFTEDQKLSNFKNRFVITISSMENIFTLPLTFFYKMPLCSKGKSSKVLFRCDQNPMLNFGIFSTTTKSKTRTLRLWNKLPSELFIKRMEILASNPTFTLTLNITHYFDRSRIQHTYTILSNETQKETLNLLLLKEEMCVIEVTIGQTKTEPAKQMGLHFTFPIKFILSDGQAFVLNAGFRFVQGKIYYTPHVVNVNLIYPGPVLSRSFKITSTFAEELNFEDTMITGPSKDMIHIYQMDRSFEESLNDMEIRFSIDPSFILRQTSFYSQVNQTEDSLCLWDVEKYNNTHMVWQKLVKEGLDKINAVIYVVTNLHKNIKIAVRGRIVYPELTKLPLVLTENLSNKLNYHTLTITNVFKKNLRFKLLLAPQNFLSMDSIDDEIISLIEKQARPDGQNVICIEHNSISSENIKFFTRKLYLENLQFVNHPKPHLSSVNHACFRFPEAAAEREKFFLNFKTTTNFFFRFSQYNDKQDKTELLSKHLILINDVHKYADNLPLNNQEFETVGSASKSETVWMYFSQWIHCITSLRSYLTSFFYRCKKPILLNPNVIYLNHVKNIEEYIGKQNIFINPAYKESVFVVPPLSSIKIKNALIVRTNDEGNFSSIPINLILKNNITAIYKIPLMLKKASLELEQVRPDSPFLLSTTTERRVIYLSVSKDCFKRKTSKSKISQLSYTQPVIKRIEIKNSGTSSVRVLKARFANAKRRSGCLELFDFRPKTLTPGQTIKFDLLVFFCRKTNSYYIENIDIHTKTQSIRFVLVIKLEGFYVGSAPRSTVYLIFWFLQNLLYIILAISFLWRVLNKKRPWKVDIAVKKANATFIPDTLLKDKLIVYNCRLNPSDFQLHGRFSSVPQWLKTATEMKNIKLIDDGDIDSNPNNELMTSIKKLSKKKKTLNKILKDKHHYSTIKTNNPVENSYMSVEQICQLLDPEKSSSEEKHNRRKQLISQAEFSKEEHNFLAFENKFGSIGDRLGGKEEVSNISFQTDHLNDISHSKTQRGLIHTSNLNPDTLVYSFINKKLLEEEENDADHQINSKDFEEEIKEFDKLGQIFDIAPLSTPKPRANLNFFSQKMVSFKLEDHDSENKHLLERKRTQTDAKNLFRKNSELDNLENAQQHFSQKSPTENLSKEFFQGSDQ